MENCENCGNTAMPPEGWSDWTCAECGHTQGDPVPEDGYSVDDLLNDVQ